MDIKRDCEKNNLALMHGWRVFQFTDHHIKKLEAIDFIKQFYQQHIGE